MSHLLLELPKFLVPVGITFVLIDPLTDMVSVLAYPIITLPLNVEVPVTVRLVVVNKSVEGL